MRSLCREPTKDAPLQQEKAHNLAAKNVNTLDEGNGSNSASHISYWHEGAPWNIVLFHNVLGNGTSIFQCELT